VARVGILGGTFNPPHLGHLAVAVHARDELSLERVIVVPARISPHKLAEQDPGPEHRLQMCRLAIERTDRLSVCALEINRRGPSYTVDTLNAIHASHPDAGLTFIVGADTAGTLHDWREPAKLLELADLAVAAREGSDRRRVLDMVAPLTTASGGPQDRVRFLEMPVMPISSSMVRRRVERGEPIEDMVGPKVARYIFEHGLYRGAVEPRS
jgi:nicotinate-nucleotide adenylyltransferase